MEKLQQLYEGKAKKVFATDDPELLIVDYKDDATAFNGLKKGTIAGKGVINNQMSNRLMAYLEKQGIPTHFVKELSERETLVKKVSIVPLEVIVRNIAAGSFSKHYGVEEGVVFEQPTIEFSYKNDELGDPLDDLPLNDRGHFASLPADWGNPERELSQRQFIEILELCTDKLPAAQGRAFMMREWLELPAEDICKELDVSTTNLYVLLHRARLRLRACLELNWFGHHAAPTN